MIKNQMANNDHSTHSGFLLGVLTGAAVTLFLTTKKGRNIIQSLTDEGSGLLSEIEDLLKEKVTEVKEKEEELRPVIEKKVHEVTNDVQEEVSKVVSNLSETIEQTIHEKVDKSLKKALAAIEDTSAGKTVEHEIKKLELIERAQGSVAQVEKVVDQAKEKLAGMEEKIMDMPEVRQATKTTKRFFKRKK